MELADLYENLSIAEEDGAILEATDEVQQDGVKDVERCLVGRVLSNKKVNREAFRGLIDQLWSPFGSVEIELIGENTFMFYFVNRVDRNRFWQRGPWHFGKSLIVLEKPVGFGDIKNLKFSRAEFWVQVHDIPISCMNRRSAKWLAKQIGGVIEIPVESKECWGKFIRVKVEIDISKPLKRWLRLKLDKSDIIVVVGLKYERLPDFCFVCGKLGHVVKDCLDEEARSGVLGGSSPKFGSWLKAPSSERTSSRFQPAWSGSSSERERTVGWSPEVPGGGSSNLKLGSLLSQDGESAGSALVVTKLTAGNRPETLTAGVEVGIQQVEKMVIDGPRIGPESGSSGVSQLSEKQASKELPGPETLPNQAQAQLMSTDPP
ncbi:hypothetical protein EZV62_015033 [Acer yangbiense]|uniref:CCHC-type domain-containing protein n=1 Tax=Acer yangbiense TaxID=1000413 RepID=A0A5C7HU60_9ROSI|nr:hypothetical protein EZV62_015033 [Acer yangbiense]